jgi:hypothetical protein
MVWTGARAVWTRAVLTLTLLPHPLGMLLPVVNVLTQRRFSSSGYRCAIARVAGRRLSVLVLADHGASICCPASKIVVNATTHARLTRVNVRMH